MFFALVAALCLVVHCDVVYAYSSFYAPLVNPHQLGYRVDARFNENSGQRAREEYQRVYGYRGLNLIEDLGTGRGPGNVQSDSKEYGEVKFYYTYPGAYN